MTVVPPPEIDVVPWAGWVRLATTRDGGSSDVSLASTPKAVAGLSSLTPNESSWATGGLPAPARPWNVYAAFDPSAPTTSLSPAAATASPNWALEVVTG